MRKNLDLSILGTVSETYDYQAEARARERERIVSTLRHIGIFIGVVVATTIVCMFGEEVIDSPYKSLAIIGTYESGKFIVRFIADEFSKIF